MARAGGDLVSRFVFCVCFVVVVVGCDPCCWYVFCLALLTTNGALLCFCCKTQEWHKRVGLMGDDAAKIVLTYSDAVTTVDPMKATGNSTPRARAARCK